MTFIQLRSILQEVRASAIQIIAYLKFYSYLPGTNELMC